MALSAATTAEIVKKHQRAVGDTGSTEVQVALLSERIRTLTEHMKTNPKDFHTRYGLTRLVSQRRSLLAYLKRVNLAGHRALLDTLGIRG
jgi:small subunit ribosomal protein S15